MCVFLRCGRTRLPSHSRRATTQLTLAAIYAGLPAVVFEVVKVDKTRTARWIVGIEHRFDLTSALVSLDDRSTDFLAGLVGERWKKNL